MSLRRQFGLWTLSLCFACFVDESGSSAGSTAGSTTGGSTTGLPTSSASSDPSTSASDGSTSQGSGTTGGPTAWRQRLRIVLDAVDGGTGTGTGTGTGGPDPVLEPEVNVPVLVRLRQLQFDYASAAADGSDLRFVTSLDAIEALPYEVETWNPAGESLVWVRLPDIGGPESPDEFWLLYGDTGLPAPASPEEVWSEQFVGVWHFADETPDGEFIDSTGLGNAVSPVSDLTVYGLGTGQIGSALELDDDGYLQAENANSLTLQALTLEAWVRPTTVTTVDGHRLIVTKGGAYDLGASHGTAGDPFIAVHGSDDLTTLDQDALETAAWTYVVGTNADNALRLYIDAAEASMVTSSIVADDTFTPLDIGVRFAGRIDELRLSATARSERWIQIQYLSATDALLESGQPEPFP